MVPAFLVAARAELPAAPALGDNVVIIVGKGRNSHLSGAVDARELWTQAQKMPVVDGNAGTSEVKRRARVGDVVKLPCPGRPPCAGCRRLGCSWTILA